MIPIGSRFWFTIFAFIGLVTCDACSGQSSRDVAPDALPTCAALGCDGPNLACNGLGSGRHCYCSGQACEPPPLGSPRDVFCAACPAGARCIWKQTIGEASIQVDECGREPYTLPASSRVEIGAP